MTAVPVTTSAGSGDNTALVPHDRPVDLDRAAAAVGDLLDALGLDVTSDGLTETPTRVARMYAELLFPQPFQATTFHNDAGYDELVLVSDIPVVSLCEHHLLPFRGVAHVGYVPRDRIVGLSKLARLVEAFAHRPQVQERLTAPRSPTGCRRTSRRRASGARPDEQGDHHGQRHRTHRHRGGGLAAAKAAEAVRTDGFDGSLRLLTEEPHRPYERPPLSKGVLLGTATVDETEVHDEQWYADQQVELVASEPVVTLDRLNREVVAASGTRYPYDRVILATGAAPRQLPVPGAGRPRRSRRGSGRERPCRHRDPG